MITKPYKIIFKKYRNYNAIQSYIQNYTEYSIDWNSYQTTNELGVKINMCPTVDITIQAVDINNYNAKIILINLDETLQAELQRTMDQIYIDEDNNYILLEVYLPNKDDVLVKAFAGQIVTGLPDFSLTQNQIVINAVPSFYVAQKGFQISISKTSNGKRTTNLMLKQAIANKYNLSVISYNTEEDEKQIENDIEEFINKPILWLQNYFYNEIISITNDTIYFFPKNTNSSNLILKNNKMENYIESFDTPFFISKINNFVYDIKSSILLPEIIVGLPVNIKAVSYKNLQIVNGELSGVVIGMKTYYHYSALTGTTGNTTFRIKTT